MAGGNPFELVGFKECREALQELTRTVGGNAVKRAMEPAARLVGDAAQANAPVSTAPHNPTPGSLKASKQIKRGKGTKTPTVAVIFEDIAAVPTEYGLTSRRYPPKPWFRPAVDANETAAIHAFASALKPEVAKAAEKAAKRSAKARVK